MLVPFAILIEDYVCKTWEAKMKNKRIIMTLLIAVLALTYAEPIRANAATQDSFEYNCVYAHDPRMNSKAMEDIVVDANAIYGFSPDPNSKRLGEYATYDWSDPEVVEKARQDRIKYLADFDQQYDLWIKMAGEGKSTEEIARAVSAKRNETRLLSYKDNPEGLKKVMKSNLESYGNEYGPTPESLFEKYGSWETVIMKSFSSNSGMDACLGLYDEQYAHNMLTNAIAENESIIYTVRDNDYLIKIAEKYYGDQRLWVKIYEANQDKIDGEYTIYIGEQLLIP